MNQLFLFFVSRYWREFRRWEREKNPFGEVVNFPEHDLKNLSLMTKPSGAYNTFLFHLTFGVSRSLLCITFFFFFFSCIRMKNYSNRPSVVHYRRVIDSFITFLYIFHFQCTLYFILSSDFKWIFPDSYILYGLLIFKIRRGEDPRLYSYTFHLIYLLLFQWPLWR